LTEQVILPTTESKNPRFFYGYVVVVAACTVIAVLSAANYSYGIFLKPMAAEFDWTRAMTSGAHSTAMLVQGFILIVTGRLTDRFGPRIVTVVCSCLYALGLFLMAQIEAVWHLYLFWGVIVGLGTGGGLVPMTSTVARWFVKRRGLMNGIVVAGVGIGTMIGPPASSHFLLSYGWRTSYVIIGGICLVLLVVASQFLRRDPEQKGLLPYGSSLVEQKEPTQDLGGFSLSGSLHTRQLWMICTIYMLFGISQMAIMIHIVPHATDQGISPIAAANIMTVIGGLGIAGRVILGGAADRIGNKKALIIGLGLMSVAVFSLQISGDMWLLYIFAAAFGFGYGGEIALMSPVMAELFGLRALGVILGVVSCAYFIGCAIGPLVAGHMFDVTGNYYSAFLICGIFCIIGLILVLLLKSTHKELLTETHGQLQAPKNAL